MTDKFPGYDVLSKKDGPSWNDRTRQVIDERLATNSEAHSFLSPEAWLVLKALCRRIIPQNTSRADPVPIEAILDRKLLEGLSEGYQDARLPPAPLAWSLGLKAIDHEASLRKGRSFAELDDGEQDMILTAVSAGKVRSPLWSGLPSAVFFKKRVLHDIVSIYYAFPASWNEIGFGGPASPRGYVRLGFDRRDPWEAFEAEPGHYDEAVQENAKVR